MVRTSSRARSTTSGEGAPRPVSAHRSGRARSTSVASCCSPSSRAGSRPNSRPGPRGWLGWSDSRLRTSGRRNVHRSAISSVARSAPGSWANARHICFGVFRYACERTASSVSVGRSYPSRPLWPRMPSATEPWPIASSSLCASASSGRTKRTALVATSGSSMRWAMASRPRLTSFSAGLPWKASSRYSRPGYSSISRRARP